MPGICDVHTHILPGMDDGCKTPEESLSVLRAARAQGIRQIFATPHYYAPEPVEQFLRRREAAAQLLRRHMTPAEPEICLGAEVAFYSGMSRDAHLEKLCLGASRYLLLELPFEPWSSDVRRELRNLCSIRGITPILAHIERYIPLQSSAALGEVLEMDVLVQMNAGYLLRFGSRRKACQLLKSGTVQLLGSDCHNMTHRPPNLGPAVSYLEKKGMTGVLARGAELSSHIFAQAQG